VGGEEPSGGSLEEPELWSQLTPENRRRLTHILREQIPEVFRANRVIERKTGYRSKICSQMMVDVLSHLGTLAQREHELSPEAEASQLAKIEEHLRRAIIEHPEEVLRNRVVDVRALWSTYHREAYPYRQAGTLHGAPRHQELEELRQRIDVLLEAARRIKPDETTWDESLGAAASVTEAADITAELADKLEQCIGQAQRFTQERRDRDVGGRRFRTTIVVAILIAIFTTIGGYLLGKESSDDAGTSGSGNPPAKSR
jgi:hypothetical protein